MILGGTAPHTCQKPCWDGHERGLDVGLDAEMDCVYRVRHEERRVRKGRIR